MSGVSALSPAERMLLLLRGKRRRWGLVRCMFVTWRDERGEEDVEVTNGGFGGANFFGYVRGGPTNDVWSLTKLEFYKNVYDGLGPALFLIFRGTLVATTINTFIALCEIPNPELWNTDLLVFFVALSL